MTNLLGNSCPEITILNDLMEIPSSPFYETSISNYIQKYLNFLGLESKRDQYGNLFCRYTSGSIKNTPAIALIAHMDHPGIELVKQFNKNPDKFLATALGGVPAALFNGTFPVIIVTNQGDRIRAESSPLEKSSNPEKDPNAHLLIQTFEPTNLTPPLQIIFDVPEFYIKDEMIFGRALDDLAGCSAILSAMKDLITNKKDADVFAVFTRAEEIGLIGARLLASNKTIPESTIIVSIESSPVIPGVTQGNGPVIRTGDALTTFDSTAEVILSNAAKSLRKDDPSFQFQRQLMSGGACEATAFAKEGYRVTGIALPLKNWHNATSDLRDPDGDIGPEYISISDYLNAVKLITMASTIENIANISEVQTKFPAVSNETIERLENSIDTNSRI